MRRASPPIAGRCPPINAYPSVLSALKRLAGMIDGWFEAQTADTACT
ncbi:hypothetical protein [Sphingobium nicotianae]|nr:hypothetical protein [Sphingobium nicotianae]